MNQVLEGFNGTVFAYGQTGTGKTFSMEVCRRRRRRQARSLPPAAEKSRAGRAVSTSPPAHRRRSSLPRARLSVRPPLMRLSVSK